MKAGACVRPEDDSGQQKLRGAQFRLASLGLEFGSGIAGFVIIGWWIDHSFGTAPKALVTASVIGSIGGLYVLIRRSYEIQKQFSARDREGRQEKHRIHDDSDRSSD
ncbi:MAG: AtpZ/AtpI family protein [Phycisphaerales bacterium]|nr:AtpZ/AtpI family protein [Phycisphaerales bacterium]